MASRIGPQPNEKRRPGTGGALNKANDKDRRPSDSRTDTQPQAAELERRADDLLIRLAGAPVVVGYGPRGTVYRTLGGKMLPRRVVEHLIQAGRLMPCGDGLLPGCSQTMRAAGGGP